MNSYIRVSRVKGRGGGSYHTVDDQRRAIRDYAKAHGVDLGVEVVDEDASIETQLLDVALLE